MAPQSDAVVLACVPFKQHALFLIKFYSLLQLFFLVSPHPPVKSNFTPTFKQKVYTLMFQTASPLKPSMIFYSQDPFVLLCLILFFFLINLTSMLIFLAQNALPPSVHADTSIKAG